MAARRHTRVDQYPGRPAGRVLAWVGFGLLVGLVVAPVAGCNPRTHYKTLSFFFDGVPDPNAPAPGSEAARAAARGRSGARPSFAHAPFANNECKACHVNVNDIFAKNPVRPDVCATCHAEVKTKHAVMHGPVLLDACTLCHSPHQSIHPDLLKRKSPDVCTQCHVPGTLGPTPAAHADPAGDCISCHSGHGGRDRNLLRVVAPEAERDDGADDATGVENSGGGAAP